MPPATTWRRQLRQSRVTPLLWRSNRLRQAHIACRGMRFRSILIAPKGATASRSYRPARMSARRDGAVVRQVFATAARHDGEIGTRTQAAARHADGRVERDRHVAANAQMHDRLVGLGIEREIG